MKEAIYKTETERKGKNRTENEENTTRRIK